MSEAALETRGRRQVWARPGGQHDWLVRALRWALPVGILALVVVLATAPLRRAREVNFLVDKKTAERAPERMRLQTARYTGSDGRGRPFVLDADSAVQTDPRSRFVTMNGMRAELRLDTGPAVVEAPAARYDIRAQTVAVDGPVRFRGADGYRLDAGAAVIDLKTQTLVSREPLSFASADGRRVTAGAATVDLNKRTVASDAPVTVAAPGGYELRTGNAAVAFGERRVLSGQGGRVAGRLPLGTFTAGTMELDAEGQSVVLGGGARLHIVQGAIK